MKTSSKWIVAVVVAGVVVCGLFWYGFLRELPQLDSALTAPAEVILGETFSMVVTTTNPHDEAITLDSIDIDDALLAAFQVVDVTPEHTDTMHIPVLDQRSWMFEKPVTPGATLAVTFTLRAVAPGHFSGNVDVCNPNQDFTSLFADIVVTEEE